MCHVHGTNKQVKTCTHPPTHIQQTVGSRCLYYLVPHYHFLNADNYFIVHYFLNVMKIGFLKISINIQIIIVVI